MGTLPTLNFGGGGGSNTDLGKLPGQASNQYFPIMPSLPQSSPPGVVPAAPNANTPGSGSNVAPFTKDIGGGQRAIGPLDPNLTGSLFNFLANFIGQGATPFNLSSLLPTGGSTQPGQLSAPLNPVLQQIMSFFTQGGSGGPGLDTLSQFSKGIDTLPSYNAITGAMDRNIAEGRTNLAEQFNVGGGLVGTPYGTSATDYETQAAKDKSSILSQLYQNTLGLQEGAASNLAGIGSQTGQEFQQLDQSAIQSMLQEFIRTRPEYSPLLNMLFGAATTFPPTFQGTQGGGILSSIMGNSGGIASILKLLMTPGGA